MRHAGPGSLDRLEPLLAAVRDRQGLIEKGRGVFYRRSRAFLHFHEDPSGLFADVRAADGKGFERLRVDGEGGPAALIRALDERLSAPP